ncbi:DUF6542 domain-containing protein [Solicola gregarius]|uniref:DUF6542 domain-containing protein n=1 Tax=Solicola gregarius TaxID=2908642 RepID=A0AA46TJ35_9ACTN|nr:DUF6542 domain-containing protein [Solicola gregarius]UYM06241.1 hypothetical protein L0C25_03950 [Solicola gregarius]
MSSVHTVLRTSPLGRLAARDLSGAQICAGAAAAMAAVTAVSIGLTGELGIFFGGCFVLVSVSSALAADIRSLFTPGVLPPLLLVSVLVTVAVVAPQAIDAPGLAESAGVTQRTIAGVVQHATALIVGHLLALGTVAYRIVNSAERR